MGIYFRFIDKIEILKNCENLYWILSLDFILNWVILMMLNHLNQWLNNKMECHRILRIQMVFTSVYYFILKFIVVCLENWFDIKPYFWNQSCSHPQYIIVSINQTNDILYNYYRLHLLLDNLCNYKYHKICWQPKQELFRLQFTLIYPKVP